MSLMAASLAMQWPVPLIHQRIDDRTPAAIVRENSMVVLLIHIASPSYSELSFFSPPVAHCDTGVQSTRPSRAVVSFTVLVALFYTRVVAAGTTLYGCPFQRSTGILETTRKPGNCWRLCPAKCHFTHIRQLEDLQREFVSAFHRINDIMRSMLSREISPSRMLSGIHSTSTKVGHQIIILLLRIDRGFGNAERISFQGFRRFRRAVLSPTATEGVCC
jgi:hypothetical protein